MMQRVTNVPNDEPANAREITSLKVESRLYKSCLVKKGREMVT